MNNRSCFFDILHIEHNKELDGALYKPEEPVIFTKADSALLKDGKPFFIPEFSKQVDYETEIVVRICKLGKSIPQRFAYRYYDAVTVGIDFTARDLQRKFRKEGKPWEICKGFDGSAVIGDWVEVEKFRDIQSIHFHLNINGKTVQEGCTNDMLFKVDEIIAYISKYFTLKTGDSSSKTVPTCSFEASGMQVIPVLCVSYGEPMDFFNFAPFDRFSRA